MTGPRSTRSQRPALRTGGVWASDNARFSPLFTPWEPLAVYSSLYLEASLHLGASLRRGDEWSAPATGTVSGVYR